MASKLSPIAEPLYYLGLIEQQRGHDETAVERWEKARNLRPNSPEVNFMLGEMHLRFQRIEAAKDAYERALEQDPSKPVYYARLGGIDILRGAFEPALDVFQRGAQRFPNNPDMHYFVALAARGTGNYDLAQTALRKSLSIQADHVDALALLGAIRADRGDFTVSGSSMNPDANVGEAIIRSPCRIRHPAFSRASLAFNVCKAA